MISLERPKADGGKGLWSAIKERRSFRDFSGTGITKGELSQLLWASTGITEERKKLRAAPSAGATYPVETYIVVNNVWGLQPGVYHYDIEKHVLREIKKGDFRYEVADAAMGQDMCAKAAAIFVWTVTFQRTASRYGEKAERYVFLDAGHIAQNLLLSAEALGLGACPVAAFHDEEMNRLIGVDGKKEFVAYLAAVGKKA